MFIVIPYAYKFSRDVIFMNDQNLGFCGFIFENLVGDSHVVQKILRFKFLG